MRGLRAAARRGLRDRRRRGRAAAPRAADERTLINQVKALAPAAQEHGAALIVAAEGEADLATVAARGGADGVHVAGDPARVRELRERLKAERAIGVGAHPHQGRRHERSARPGPITCSSASRVPTGPCPSLESVVERAAWWAEIFETPCVAFAPSLEAVAALAATQAEFIALGDAVWSHPDGPAAAVKAAAEILRAPEASR